jgi:hypothetical protein
MSFKEESFSCDYEASHAMSCTSICPALREYKYKLLKFVKENEDIVLW